MHMKSVFEQGYAHEFGLVKKHKMFIECGENVQTLNANFVYLSVP